MDNMTVDNIDTIFEKNDLHLNVSKLNYKVKYKERMEVEDINIWIKNTLLLMFIVVGFCVFLTFTVVSTLKEFIFVLIYLIPMLGNFGLLIHKIQNIVVHITKRNKLKKRLKFYMELRIRLINFFWLIFIYGFLVELIRFIYFRNV